MPSGQSFWDIALTDYQVNATVSTSYKYLKVTSQESLNQIFP